MEIRAHIMVICDSVMGIYRLKVMRLSYYSGFELHSMWYVLMDGAVRVVLHDLKIGLLQVMVSWDEVSMSRDSMWRCKTVLLDYIEVVSVNIIRFFLLILLLDFVLISVVNQIMAALDLVEEALHPVVRRKIRPSLVLNWISTVVRITRAIFVTKALVEEIFKFLGSLRSDKNACRSKKLSEHICSKDLILL